MPLIIQELSAPVNRSVRRLIGLNMVTTPRDSRIPEFEFPKEGILWRSFDDTINLLKEKARPVLVFVMDHDGLHWPFLREVFSAMPKNEKLRSLLNGPCAAMLLQGDSIPEYMAALGAGGAYHIAVLSPAGLTPMVTYNHVTGKPDELVEKIATALEKLAPIWN